MWVGRREFISFRKLSDSFDHGPVDCVAENQPIVYCGLTLVKAGKSYGISKGSRRDNVHLLRTDDFVGKQRKRHTAEAMEKETRRFIGGMSRMDQTRYDLPFTVTLLASPLSLLRPAIDSCRIPPNCALSSLENY